MISEEQFLTITVDILGLPVDPWLKYVKSSFTFTSQLISVQLLNSKLIELLESYETRKADKDRILASNRSRLIQADTLKWNTEAGSVTYDIDVLLDDVKKSIYLLLNMNRFGIPINFTDDSNISFVAVGRG